MKNFKNHSKIKLIKICIFTFLVTINFNLFSKTIKAKIIKIVDGDTVVVRTVNNIKMKIRLSGIDAPERKQAHGINAANFLKKLIFSKIVNVHISNKDRYKRHIGTVFLKKTNINLELVRTGNAWAYRKYLSKMSKKKEEAFVRAESYAQYNRIGLWSDLSPVPPWIWRKEKK